MVESQLGAVSKVFISHTHQDKALADALSEAFRDLFGEQVQVRYSTAKELDAGIRPGEDWLKWIAGQVQESRVALVLLTTASIQKPWILWEAGAVAGAALSGSDGNTHTGHPTVENLRSIEDGLMRLGKSLEKGDATLTRWSQALRGS